VAKPADLLGSAAHAQGLNMATHDFLLKAACVTVLVAEVQSFFCATVPGVSIEVYVLLSRLTG
jgi:hypothetical protein